MAITPFPALRTHLANPVLFVRLGLIADALGWCVVLALPGDTFTLSKSYLLLASLMPEWAWSILFGMEALACAAGLLCRPGLFRSLAPVGAAILYGFVVLSALQVRPVSTALVAYPVVMANAYWLIWMEGTARQRRRRGEAAK